VKPASNFEKGSSWHPDAVEEFLPSNLLSVASLPTKLYCATTTHRKFDEIWKVAPSANPFLLKSGMLYTFSDLGDSNEILSSFVDTTKVTKVETAEWLRVPDRRPWLIELLNRCLSKHLWRQGLKCVDRRYYFPPGKSDNRKVKTLSGFNRSVAKEIGTEAPKFWFHMGCRARFMIVGDNLAIWVEPCFLFTVDGAVPVNGKAMGKLSQIWGGKQQNDHIFRDILFWFDVIKGIDPDEGILTGSTPIYLATLPLSAAAAFGIEGDKINFKALRKMEGDDLKAIAEEIL
jgi:hypothetical protein